MTEQLIVNEATLEELKKVNVLAAPDISDEEVEIEKKLKAIQKGATFSYKLSADQLSKICREAEVKGLDWQEHLKRRVTEEIFGGLVGQALISKPSFAKTTVVAPTGSVRRG